MQGQPAADQGSVLVLVVESDPYIRALQQRLLGKRYTVHLVADGALAVEAARRLILRLLIPHGRIIRTLAVVKCRGRAHDSWIRQMTIGTAGIEVDGAPPKAGG